MSEIYKNIYMYVDLCLIKLNRYDKDNYFIEN